ncbi:MAG: FAD-binding oxidoreductase [Nitriliruptorales bacterium]
MTRSWWGWGDQERHLDRDALESLGAEIARRFGLDGLTVRDPADVEDLDLAPPRLEPPPALAKVTDDRYLRALHGHGQSFRDVARAFRGDVPGLPDLVAMPDDAEDVARILDWCADASAACVPFGGGTSVVGGVTRPPDDGLTVSLDLAALAGILEVDVGSQAARIGAGTPGPAIEDGLRPHGLTLRFFPQSWEFSTLGGWIATRAAGHHATLRTHIDDHVEAVSAVTPTGRWESRRLPASGAGPSPDRLLLGSEGSLGVVTEAWVRVIARPVFRADATVTFPDFTTGAGAVRALTQSGLCPAGCRLLDPAEAAISGAGNGSVAVLVLGFESADHPLDPWVDRAVELCRDHGASSVDGPHLREGDRTGAAEGAGGRWRETFLQAPYLRDALVALGTVVETFESAMTWERLDGFVTSVSEAARTAAEEVCGAAHVAVRLTHAYPDGAAPYWTVVAPGRDGSQVEQWDEIKAAVGEAILAAGGTITHHHAVGRDHRPWYDRQRPDPFARALAAAKRELDPAGIMNPGALL